MNAFYIVTEVSGLQQFLKINDPAAADVLKNCERSLKNAMRVSTLIQGSLIIYTIESELENAAAVYESASSVLDILGCCSEDIHDFSMLLLYRYNSDVNKLAAEMKQNYFSLCEDYSMLIERRITEAAKVSLPEAPVPGYQILKFEADKAGVRKESSAERFIETSAVERLKNIMIPDIENGNVPQRIIITGNSELVLRANLDAAVENAAVRIDFIDRETDVVMPFARSIDPKMANAVEDYLDGVELKTWLAGRDRIQQINSDYPGQYFFSVYLLYLKGVLKSFEERLLPQVVILSGIDSRSEDQLSFFKRLMETLEKDCSPVCFIIKSSSDSTLEFYDDDFFQNAVETDCCRRIKTAQNFTGLNYHNTKLLFTLKLTEGLFCRDDLNSFMATVGYSSAELNLGIEELENSGFLIDGRFIRIINRDGYDDIFSKISDKEDLYKALGSYISDNINTGIIRDFGLAARRLLPGTAEQAVGSAVFACLSKMLNYGRSEWVLDYIEEQEDGEGLEPQLAAAVRLRAMLLENDKQGCLHQLEILPDNPMFPESMNSALLMFSAARYYHAASDYQRALDYIKKVLIYLQSGDYPAEEGDALTELGFLMLCKGKLLESSEYMNLAIERLTGTADSYSMMKALLFSAMQQYLWGSLDSALSFTERASEIAGSRGFIEWDFYITFFKCRLFFELGRYYDAEKVLADSLLGTEIYLNDARHKIFSAWTARACVYQGKIYRGINMLLSLEKDPEVLFFLAEAYYFNGNMEKAVDAALEASSSDEYFNLGFMPLEHINWKNGFNSIEGRVLRTEKGTGVLLHNIRAFHAFMLGMTGNREYGTEILFSLTRDEKISENDPFNRMYFYFYCQLLERRQNADMVDKLTLISKALKYLQQTSSRITNPKVRQQFMMKNYWNARLVSEAQNEKLI